MTNHLIAPELLRARVREVPALPQVVTDLLAALERDDVPVERYADKVALDQGLTAKTLRLANSSFYGVPGRIHTIRDAINILGVRTLSAVVTAAAARACFQPTSCAGFDFEAFWRHAVSAALTAQSLARTLDLDSSNAFTAGLLHDIGQLALASHFPHQYAQVLAWQATQDCQTLHAERTLLGVDHAEAGALIAEHWRFPTAIVSALRSHHEPAVQAPASALVDVVHLADNIAHALDLARLPHDMVPPLSLDTWERLALKDTQLLSIFEGTEVQVRSVCLALAP